jgi:hypothetical protein
MLDGSAKVVKTADRLRDPWRYSEISSGVPIWRWALALAWHSLLPRFAAALAITLWFHYLLSLPLTTTQRVISLLSVLLLRDTISHPLWAQSRFAKNVLRVIALVLLPMYGVPVVVGLQGLGLYYLLEYITTATHNFYARYWIYVVSFSLDPIWYPNPVLTYIGLLLLAALTGALVAYGLFVPVSAMADWLLSFPAVHGALGGGQSIKGTADQSPLIGALVVGFISGYKANTHFVKLFRFNRPPLIEHLHLPRAAKTERQFLVAHVSDIHLTGGEPTIEGHPSPDPNFELICASPKLVDSDLIIVTGDATDAGLPGEWAKFFDCLPESALSKTVLVPGNHDVNIVSKHWARIEDADSISRSQRLVRMMSALGLR